MTTFASVLQALQERDPRVEAHRSEITDLVLELRNTLESGPDVRLSLSLDAALHLTRLWDRIDDVSRDELHGMIYSLVAFTERTVMRKGGVDVPAEFESAQPLQTSSPSLAEDPNPTPVPSQAPAIAVGSGAKAAGGIDEAYGELDKQADFMLGELLVELGLVAKEAVNLACEAQASHGERLGEVLVNTGLIRESDLQMALSLQAHVSRVSLTEAKKKGYVDQWSLGQLLVSKGVIDKDMLEQGLAHHRSEGIKLGESLVDLAAITWDDVAEAIRFQKEAR